jgi:heme/copper-type cytochrome/quinol oxidase subunit 2
MTKEKKYEKITKWEDEDYTKASFIFNSIIVLFFSLVIGLVFGWIIIFLYVLDRIKKDYNENNKVYFVEVDERK